MAIRQNAACRWLFIAAACCACSVPVSAAAEAGFPGVQTTVQDTPYTVREREVERNVSVMDVWQTSVSKGVTYSDLDLSKDADVEILRDRAREAALDVCREADRRAVSPFDRGINYLPDCRARARRQALAQVNRIVADVRAGQTFAAK